MTKFSNYSRLANKQEKGYRRKAAFYIFLTMCVLVLIAVFGLPGLIRLAALLGQVKTATPEESVDNSLPLAAPMFQTIPEATNSATIKLSGFAEPKKKIELFLNDQKTNELNSDENGNFEFENVLLTMGENEIYAIASDEQNKISPPSIKIKIIFADQGPTLTISEPVEGSEFFWPQERITIKGQTTPESAVTINGKVALVDSNGMFQFPYRLQPGENKITAVSVDEAGNRTETSVTVRYFP